MSSLGSEEPSPRPGDPSPRSEVAGEHREPTLGPLLTLLLEKVPIPSTPCTTPQVATLPQHCLATNLRLTALVSKLAAFPHPLLKAVLLHPDVVVQPTCLTLAQVCRPPLVGLLP